MDVSEAKRLKALEDKNAKLKKLLAESMLDAASLRELLVKKMVWPAARREAVARLRAVLDLSERRACTIVSADRTMIRYRSLRPADSALRDRSGTLANERRRFGYRRLCGQAHRNGRSAAQPRPAPPIGHCSTCARPRTLRSDSRRRWMSNDIRNWTLCAVGNWTPSGFIRVQGLWAPLRPSAEGRSGAFRAGGSCRRGW